MKVNVGDYVITNDRLHIGKIYNINEFREPSMMYAIDFPNADDFIFMGENDFKSSPNIIDLVEEHDVIVVKERSGDLSKYEVEEYEIVDIYSMKTRIKSLGIFIDNHYKSLQEVESIIKSIVTKERFERMEYKI